MHLQLLLSRERMNLIQACQYLPHAMNLLTTQAPMAEPSLPSPSPSIPTIIFSPSQTSTLIISNTSSTIASLISNMSTSPAVQYYHHGRFKVSNGVIPDAVTAFKTYGNPENPCIVFPTCFGGKLASRWAHLVSFSQIFLGSSTQGRTI